MGGGLAALGAAFFAQYLNNKFNEERKARIERVNLQLKLFYGPLLACVATTKRAYDAMLALHSPDGTRETFQATVQEKPDSEEAKAYRYLAVPRTCPCMPYSKCSMPWSQSLGQTCHGHCHAAAGCSKLHAVTLPSMHAPPVASCERSGLACLLMLGCGWRA